jgi:hypothetical protein
MFAEKWKHFLHTQNINGLVLKQDDEGLRTGFLVEFDQMMVEHSRKVMNTVIVGGMADDASSPQ